VTPENQLILNMLKVLREIRSQIINSQRDVGAQIKEITIMFWNADIRR